MCFMIVYADVMFNPAVEKDYEYIIKTTKLY